jgi:hypothetical protein
MSYNKWKLNFVCTNIVVVMSSLQKRFVYLPIYWTTCIISKTINFEYTVTVT